MLARVRGIPRNPVSPKPQISPMATMRNGSNRHLTLNNNSKMMIITTPAMAPSVIIPPFR